jgi:hypothetical protein
MTNKFTRFSAWSVCALMCSSALARAQNAPAAPNAPAAVNASAAQNPTLTLCQALQSKDVGERMNAAQKLVAQESDLKNCLLLQLQAEVRNPSRKFGSSFTNLLWVLGKKRVTEAVGDLAPMVEFRLEGRPHAGGFGGAVVYYPVATALADIGGPDLPRLLLDRLAEPINDEMLRATSWVLERAYSRPVALALVQARLDALNITLNRIGGGDTNRQKKSLERIIELLNGQEPLLLEPVLPAGPPAGNAAPGTQPAEPFGNPVPK